MKIISYKYWQAGGESWEISEIKLGNLNLLVGDSGSGKTRFLNTLFNLGRIAVGNRPIGNGCWNVSFEIENTLYNWNIESDIDEKDNYYIKKETLQKIIGKKKENIVVRKENNFKFLNKKIPKLKKNTCSIALLDEEEIIKPLHKGFGQILRRNFSSDEIDRAFSYQYTLGELLDEKTDLEKVYHSNYSANLKLYYLSKKYPETYKNICDFYSSIFPFIKDIKIRNIKSYKTNLPSGFMPVISIKERHIKSWIPIDQISSGMKKVLLIIIDSYISPDGSIYLIDEYENSLGINAINFFPSFLNAFDKQIQYVITSHHPYLINNIPVESWYVFHRKGQKVSIKYGEENVKKFGKSKQQKFVQLINDPFYLEGIE